jgi:hypothetical protein
MLFIATAARASRVAQWNVSLWAGLPACCRFYWEWFECFDSWEESGVCDVVMWAVAAGPVRHVWTIASAGLNWNDLIGLSNLICLCCCMYLLNQMCYVCMYVNIATRPRMFQCRQKDVISVDSAGFLSFISFSWMSRYIYKAYKAGLTAEDIPAVSPLDSCDLNAQRYTTMLHCSCRHHVGMVGLCSQPSVLRRSGGCWMRFETLLDVCMYIYIHTYIRETREQRRTDGTFPLISAHQFLYMHTFITIQ